jgi:hypothetical protein
MFRRRKTFSTVRRDQAIAGALCSTPVHAGQGCAAAALVAACAMIERSE